MGNCVGCQLHICGVIVGLVCVHEAHLLNAPSCWLISLIQTYDRDPSCPCPCPGVQVTWSP